MEKKGLRVNAGKTMVMWCKVSMGQAKDSREHPCSVCRNVDFHCRRCLEGENDLFQLVLLKEVVIEPNIILP